MNTKISYQYRDSNEEVVLKGELTSKERETITNNLNEEKYFIPSQVGLPDLQETMSPSDDDHVWHELENMRPVNEAPTVHITTTEFAAKFKNISWDI